MIIEFEGEFMADYIIRATAADGQIRAFASTTRDLVEEARLSLIHISEPTRP